MKRDIIVSIVIPCYNLGEYLNDAIESVKLQTYKNWELIIVNDGSTDSRTNEIFEELKNSNPSFTYITQKNSGLSATRNIGIKSAKGQYIVCLDADDKLHPAFLEKVIKEFNKDKTGKIAFVTTWLQEFGNRNDIWQTSDYDPIKLLVSNVVHAGSMFRKSVWEEVGGYKLEMKGGYEDWEFWISISEKGYKWKVVEESLFLYRIRENSMLSGAGNKHSELYGKIYDLHKDLYNKNNRQLSIINAEEIKKLHATISENRAYSATVLAEKDKQIIQKNEVIQELKVKSDEYDTLFASRIMKSAKYLVGISIFARKITRQIKAIIKKNLKSSFLKKLLNKIYYILFPKKIVIVENKKWPSEKPLVSVVTPYFNQKDTILETVKSVLGQTFYNLEYIIVNDGSDSDKTQILKEIKDNRVNIINHEKNIGMGSPAAARNNGIEISRGKYIICLDSDDILDPTYIEKCLVYLESHPWVGIVSSDTYMFGAVNETTNYVDYDSKDLINNNMVITAAMFRKEAWEEVGGYKSGIGYEDWEFWISLAERGYFGHRIPEALFKYRTAHSSRYIEDKKKHLHNIRTINKLHPQYRKNIRKINREQRRVQYVLKTNTRYINLGKSINYQIPKNKKNILIAIPWMTFGGAETLILNFCNEVKNCFNLFFITGLSSANEWEYKFKEISPEVFHLNSLFDGEKEYFEYISNFISSKNIDILHIIHTSFMFPFLEEIKKRHPKLKIVMTVFNDRAHFNESIEAEKYIDHFTSDNDDVVVHYKQELKLRNSDKPLTVIPNGINCYDVYNPEIFDRNGSRDLLGLSPEDLAVFFIGRLSPEKNPDIFIKVAKKILKENDMTVKFFVIGDGVMKDQIVDEVNNIGNSNIQYLGYQSEVPKYLSAADVFVLPSSIEGFPLSILEAMAMNVCVIASNVGAVSEVISNGKDGYVINPGSVNEIADLIIELHLKRDLLSMVKSGARKKVEERYSNKILGENYKKLYNSLN